MKRFVILFLLLSIALLACPFSVNSENGKPKMALNEVTFNAGQIHRSGKKIEHAFVIKNNGDANLEILSVTPG